MKIKIVVFYVCLCLSANTAFAEALPHVTYDMVFDKELYAPDEMGTIEFWATNTGPAIGNLDSFDLGIDGESFHFNVPQPDHSNIFDDPEIFGFSTRWSEGEESNGIFLVVDTFGNYILPSGRSQIFLPINFKNDSSFTKSYLELTESVGAYVLQNPTPQTQYYLDFDSFRIQESIQAVPEPSSAILMASGALITCLFLRRKYKNNK